MAGRKNSSTGNGSVGVEVSLEPGPVNPADFGGGSVGDGNDAIDSGGTKFDSTIHVGIDSRNADGSFRRKRGRRAGSGGNGKAKVSRDLEGSIEGLSRGLAIFHVAIATATKTPEMMIGDDEAKSLASATVNVLDQYDIRPDPKIEAMVTLIGVAAATYAPRVVAIRMRKAQEAEEKKGKAGVYGPDGFPMGTTGYVDINANVQ